MPELRDMVPGRDFALSGFENKRKRRVLKVKIVQQIGKRCHRGAFHFNDS